MYNFDHCNGSQASQTIGGVTGSDLTLDANTVLTSSSTDTVVTMVHSICVQGESMNPDTASDLANFIGWLVSDGEIIV